MRVAVLGAGQMGAAFGAPLLHRDHDVSYWGPDWLDAERLEAISTGGPHPDLEAALPGKPSLVTTDLEAALDGAELCALAVASEGVGWVAERVAGATADSVPVMLFTKGFDERDGTVGPMNALAERVFGPERPVVGVGGPVKAAELVRGVPTSTVFASRTRDHALMLAERVSTPYYFPTSTDDLVGTELCAGLKNPYAIAVNLLTGREGESNLRALAFGAALGEMHEIVVAAGGRPETVAGAAGAGDLYVTCLTGRNGDFGRLLNEGHPPERAREIMGGATVEGLGALPAALGLAGQLGLDERRLPLLHYLDAVLRNEGEGRAPLARIVARAAG